MARISTHVLDIARGVPARGVVIDLHSVNGPSRMHLKTVTTNADGRADEPLLSAPVIETGVYELTFHAGDYFRSAGVVITAPPFLDEVVIRFGVADGAADYHVPLLLSPYGYSTYRGS